MLILSICKLLIDLLLYYMVCCLFLADEIGVFSVLISLAGCGISMLLLKVTELKRESIKSKTKGNLLRCGGLIFTLIPFLLPNVREGSLWGMVALGIPVFYTGYIGLRPGTEEYLESVEKHFLIYLAAGLFIVLFGQLIGNSKDAIALYLLYVLLCIFTMQIRRMYRNGNFTAKQIAMTFSILAGLSLVIVLFSSPTIWAVIGAGLRFIYLNLIVKVVILVIRVFSLLAAGIVSVISFIASLLHITVNTEESEAQVTKSVQDMEQALSGGAQIGGPWMTILCVAIVAIAAFLFFRLMNQRRSPLYRSSGVLETEERISLSHRRMPSGSVGSVRKAYRKMLVFMSDAGMGSDLKASSTSEDVARLGRAFADREVNDQLRDIYRKARYSAEAVSSEEAKKAKELVRKIVK